MKRLVSLLAALTLLLCTVSAAMAEEVDPALENGYTVNYNERNAGPFGMPFDCTSEVNWISSADGLDQIYARTYYPANFDASKTYPVVLMAHGSGITSDIYDTYYAPALAARGFVCFSWDVRGVDGDFGKSRSTNLAERQPDLVTYVTDATTAFEYVKALPFVDLENVFMWGQSMGAITTQIVTSKFTNELRATVLMYGAISPSNIASFDYNDGGVDLVGVLDAIKANYTGETFIILGADDTLFDYEISVENAAYYQDYTFLYISGANHGFGYMADRPTVIVTEAVIDYLNRVNTHSDMVPAMPQMGN